MRMAWRGGARLRGGQLVALPTETVYGLAARADSAEAVAAIYRAKGRPDFNPLIVHVPDVAAAEKLAVMDPRAQALAARFWPGALTMVLPRRADAALAPAVTAGLPTVALRCPAHPVMRAVLERSACRWPRLGQSQRRGQPHQRGACGGLAGRAPGWCWMAAIARRGSNRPLWRCGKAGGRCCAPARSPRKRLRRCWASPLPAGSRGIEAPGQMTSHYAPASRCPQRRCRARGRIPDRLRRAGGDFTSRHGDLAEAAARLYAACTQPQRPRSRVAVAMLPDTGIGAAINDRLRRAAACRRWPIRAGTPACRSHRADLAGGAALHMHRSAAHHAGLHRAVRGELASPVPMIDTLALSTFRSAIWRCRCPRC
jgi:L-threonylcarbamoyladenylate synthase